MHAFLDRAAGRHGIARDWEALRRWSIAHRDFFWADMLEFAAIQSSQPAPAVCSGSGMLGTKWFDGMTLNYARHLLRFEGDQPALIFENELGRTRTLSRNDLRTQVAQFAAALKRDGVRRGDRVAGFMPNLPETIIAMLAAASLGAIWSSCSPDFGLTGVLDRFGQIEPTVLVAVDAYSYGGKRVNLCERVEQIAAQLASLRRIVLVPYSVECGGPAGSVNVNCPVSTWGQYAQTHSAELVFEEVPFNHPLFIMYSSGTTGIPKCIVHGHGGTLLQHMKELLLHSDLHEGDRLFYFTTCGWMMWNWLASGLGVGATLVLYEGNPAHPGIEHLWDLAARTRMTHLGTSPKFIAACQKAGVEPGRRHDLSALRCILSTGSPLSAELFEWTYQNVKSDVQLASISGGTDIISCFMLGNPLLPVYAGEIQCRGLGMDVQAWDENGRPVTNQKAELVCASPFPSQPVGFWNDPDGAKYRRAYFEHFPGVWRHGDFIEITDTGGVIVYGRSDATLNPGGVRIGTAEIYRIVEGLPEVLDSIVTSKKTYDDDEEIVLFVVLRGEQKLTTELTRRIRDAIAAGATKRHVPKHIRQVSGVPHTISGKKVEIAVHQVLHGQEVKNRDALANPQVLDEYREKI